jgi:hypothetical protein
MGSDDAFYNPGLQITRDTVGRIALDHTASGVNAVQAIIAHAMGTWFPDRRPWMRSSRPLATSAPVWI